MGVTAALAVGAAGGLDSAEGLGAAGERRGELGRGRVLVRRVGLDTASGSGAASGADVVGGLRALGLRSGVAECFT